jgi:hypothetical protein
VFVVAPLAPWVFGTAASAYAILPVLFSAQVPGFEVGFAGLLSSSRSAAAWPLRASSGASIGPARGRSSPHSRQRPSGWPWRRELR